MRLRFNEAKVTQAAGVFLQLRGGTMSYMKLLKLLYFADREALFRWGRPISTDIYVSMDQGPVLSKTYNLIMEGTDIREREGSGSIWSAFISEPHGDREVSLKKEVPRSELSRAEEKLIHEIYERFGYMGRWEIRDYAHTLPEWLDPHGSSIPLEFSDILASSKLTDAERASILDELRNISYLSECLGTV